MKVLFVPVERTDPYAWSEYGQKNHDWMEHEFDAKNEVWGDVWYSGSKSPQLVGMVTGQIYVRGHGMAGDPTIEIARGGQRLHADEVVKRLIASGLKKQFTGKIKCYNCHSAEPGTSKAFAQVFADKMYSKGYRLCTYYGYDGRLDSFYKDGSQGKHKYTRDYVPTGRGGVILGEVSRAKDARYQITPRG